MLLLNIRLFLIFSCLLTFVTSNIQQQNQNESTTLYSNQSSEEKFNLEGLFLESMEDLEQIAGLSLLNFNMTGESWQVEEDLATPFNYNSIKMTRFVRSFINHVRTGHLRRLDFGELQLLARKSYKNLIFFYEENSHLFKDVDLYKILDQYKVFKFPQEDTSSSSSLSSTATRCDLLASAYWCQLLSRQFNSKEDFYSNTEGKQFNLSQQQFNGEQFNISTNLAISNYTRLEQLCQLVVRCNSAEELVNLVSESWDEHLLVKKGEEEVGEEYFIKEKRSFESSKQTESSNSVGERGTKTLRDSLSLNLAKLCPLILFQLHDEEGFCSVRRDDKPPVLTVWAFATLFVTIVSFCSLIGISITPLLGPTPNAEIDNSSTSSSSYAASDGTVLNCSQHRKVNSSRVNQAKIQIQPLNHHHKACLTLFEGLAVGSLVGSALFSLIPQAFELQERESNQSFLLKALIIFFGIYLFFCSERIMRIILDTRHRRKKQKSINYHRSSNSIPMPSTTMDGFEHHQQDWNMLTALNPTSFTPMTTSSSHRRNSDHSGRKTSTNALSNNTKLFPNLTTTTVKSDKASNLTNNSKGRQKNQRFAPAVALTQQNSDHQHIKMVGIGQTCDKVPRVVNFEARKHQRLETVLAEFQCNCLTPDIAEANSIRPISTRSRRRKTRHQLRKRQRRRHQLQLHQLPARNSESDANSSSISLASDGAIYLNNNGNESIFDESFAYQSNNGQEDPINGCDWTSDENEFCCKQMLAVNKQLNSKIKTKRDNHGDSRMKAQRVTSSRNRSDFATKDSSHSRVSSFIPSSNNQIVSPIISIEQDISTVAWMIVLGDGLHNFIDGISIGAAFSESILSGVSISVAVICEEFPHELGDFAVLVSSGMTVRQALGYNFLSACTCYFGMAVGIILGDVNDSASYISGLAGGVFLYIALVDMMGELSATLEETSRESITRTLKLLLLQNVGIFIGISIIFVLSFIDF